MWAAWSCLRQLSVPISFEFHLQQTPIGSACLAENWSFNNFRANLRDGSVRLRFRYNWFLQELQTFSLATFPETFTLAGKVGRSAVQRPLNLCQAWFILVVVHWVDSNFEHYEILLRRNNVDILISCRYWDIISEKRPKSFVHCAKTVLVIPGPDRWPLYGHICGFGQFLTSLRSPDDITIQKKASHDPWCSGWCWENPFEISPFTLYLEKWLFSEGDLYCPNPDSEAWPCLFNPLWSRRVSIY